MRRALSMLFVCLATACSRCASEEPVVDERACASACAALVAAGCERPGLLPADAAGCTSRCMTRGRELSAARCDAERSAYLSCVSQSSVDCARARAAADVVIERREGIVACAAEHAAYRACTAPCEGAGLEHMVERSVEGRPIGAATRRAGCAECPSLESGSPAGSACTSAKVCAERCCECDDRRVRFTARVCAAGSCAGDDACKLARSAGADPCAVQPR